ncbi:MULTISPECIES: septum formation initiator [Corynebacterium]|uniref:septum formation initiator n=1 Tax=Corynebacterium TaxID=1716 RepID=UPI000667E117|nr:MULTISPECIES: septum formation initiator [Corynebacterium]OFN34473.1 septum formation initiator [Corynebacterium sp. HMSC072A04]OHO56286.1 septum formation initiator [Corynebacterium sp. HMSC035E02]
MSTHTETTSSPEDTKRPVSNTEWAISLFGTAVGAGILFLPINAGSFGFWPLLAATILIGPMTYFSHRGLARMICASPRQGEDITAVVTDYFGKSAGFIISVIYFCAIFPIVLIYGVSITNTVNSFIVNQLNGPTISRPLLAFLLVGIMTIVFAFGQRIVLAVTQFLVYPLIFCLGALSIYLIPRWDVASFMEVGNNDWRVVGAVALIIPVLVFSFNHSPAISQFSLAMVAAHGREKSSENASRALALTAILLTVFTMFFVWSCTLTLGADGLAEAREQNLPVLSYLANVTGVPVLAFLSPIIAMVAIISSYFGHVLGATEGGNFLLRSAAPRATKKLSEKQLNSIMHGIIFVCAWIVAIIDPSILGLIEAIGGPFIASILYLLPMYAIHRIDALKQFRGRASNVFVVITGLIAVGATIWGLFV